MCPGHVLTMSAFLKRTQNPYASTNLDHKDFRLRLDMTGWISGLRCNFVLNKEQHVRTTSGSILIAKHVTRISRYALLILF